MKKFLVWGVGLLAVCAYAENVPTVTFNPSRMGDYSWLKVSDEAKLKGGLITPRLDLRGRSTTIQDNSEPSMPLFPTTTATTITSEGAADTAVLAPGAVFAEKLLDVCPVNPANPSNTPPFCTKPATVTATGGLMRFTSRNPASPSESTIKTLKLNNQMLQYASKATLEELHVTGMQDGTNEFLSREGTPEDTETFVVRSLHANGNTHEWKDLHSSGLVLGGKSIPYPRLVEYYYNDAPGTGDVTLTDSSCQLKWVKRYVAGDEVKAVYVLALDNCNVTEPCTEGTFPYHSRRETCPSGYEGYMYQKQQRVVTCSGGKRIERIEDVGEPDYSWCYLYRYKLFREVRKAKTCSSGEIGTPYCIEMKPQDNPHWRPDGKECYGQSSTWHKHSYCGRTWNKCTCGSRGDVGSKCIDVPSNKWGYGMASSTGGIWKGCYSWGSICWFGNIDVYECVKVSRNTYLSSPNSYKRLSDLTPFTNTSWRGW